MKVSEKIDDNVTKYVFEWEDAVAEAVLYRYPFYQERTVICCSTQAGCPVGCRFCGAGDHFKRSLTKEEILDQVSYCMSQTGVLSKDIKKLQIMFMAMGEPFLNLRTVNDVIRSLHERYPHAKLLVSTSAPKIPERRWNQFLQLASEIDTVGLQFSVHESTDELRDKLIPFKEKLTLQEMSVAGRQFYDRTGRRPFFNYCAHEGNSTADDAGRLRRLFAPAYWEATVSVICERDQDMPKTNDHQRELAVNFSKELLEFGYNVRVFDPAGQDTIGGGCGQLHFTQEWLKEHGRPSVGFDLPKVHMPVQVETLPGDFD